MEPHAAIVAPDPVRAGLGPGILGTMFLGEDLLAWLVLAFGGALFAGNLLAVVRPPAERGEGELERAPVARSLTFAGVGLVAAIWALASLFAG